MTRRLDFRLLGPLGVLDGARSLPLGGRKQRTLLAILLLHANEVVGSDSLIDGIWGERVPKTAPTALQVYVSNLRKLLSAERVETRSPGYVLRVEPDELDLARFERLCQEARGLKPEAAAVALAEALALWHGRPLADFAYDSFAQAEIARIEELRLSALEQRIDTELVLGRHAHLIGELESLVGEYPLRERLREQLILALYRSRRQAEALEAYRQARTMLVEELGIEPGAALKELERAILAQDEALEAQAPRAMPELPTGTITLLFTDIEGSTKLLQTLGRERYVEALDAYRRLLRGACLGHRGVEVEMQGDSFHFAFPSAREAVEAAAAAIRALAGHAWPGEPLRVRIGLHTGEPTPHGELYAGLDVHRAARIMGAAAGGQVLLSRTTRDLLAGELELRDLGEQRLKDMKEPERLYELVLADGEPLQAAVPVREERKVVSILFAELAGLYARAGSTDPEDVRAAIGPYEARVREEIERFGGTVERFVGETVMAVFGAAVAHEDDAERAVCAALALAEALAGETELTVRAAVATGEAVVSVAEGASAVVGEVVNAAVQLKEVAPKGGVVVDPLTYQATKDAVDYEQLASKPIASWRALRARGRSQPHRPEAGTPFIGRKDELALLQQAFARTAREASVQLVTVTGEPGIGKSRLLRELRGALDGQARWHLGRCLPYGEGISFWALGEIVKAEAGILESDDPERSAEKLRQAVASRVADPAEARWLERHLRPLVGLSAEAELAGDRRDEAFAAWRRFLEALAEQRPLVAVFEDLHFADEGLLDFVDSLVEWASGVPLLCLCTGRPELIARRPGWGGGKANATTLSLPALSDEETAQLVQALLAQPLLEAKLQATLIARAEGNPLYAEEFARLVGEGRELEELPESVQGIIAARLDTLAEEEKDLLQDASVIGKAFWLGALIAMNGRERFAAERALHELCRKQFLRRERQSSLAGEREYGFGHQLVRDVAYGQIPRARRASKHRLAAEWIETLGRPDDQAELLAHHYLTALELARAAEQPLEELETPARLALRDAGERAEALNAFASAKSFFKAALELWPPDDPDRPRLLFAYGKALAIAEQAGDEVLREATDALLAAGDRETACEAEVLLADLAFNRGARGLRDELLGRAAALAAGLPPSRLTAFVLSILSGYRLVAGESEEALRLGREALELAERLGLDEIRADALVNIGSARVDMGDAGGIADLEQGIEITANSPECVRAYNNLGSACAELGDLRRSRELTLEGLSAAERFGDLRMARWLRGNLVWVEFWAGRWDEALRLANEFIAEIEAGSPHYAEPLARWLRAAIRLARGDAEGALADAERGIEVAREAKDPQILAPALAHYGRFLLGSGLAKEAGSAAEEALASARGHVVLFAGGWPILASVLTALGRGEELVAALEAAPPTPWIEAARLYALGDFEGAAELYAEMESVPDEADARMRAAEQLLETGRRAEADAQLEQALAFYRSVGATRYIREGEALLAASA